MILRRRTVEHLTGDGLPMAVNGLVDDLIVLGGLPCSVIATRTRGPVVMAIGRDRTVALERLTERLRPDEDPGRDGAGHAPPCA